MTHRANKEGYSIDIPLKLPPANKASISSKKRLAETLSPLIGRSLPLSGKGRTDGSNLRKLVESVLVAGGLAEPCPEGQYRIVPQKGKGVPRILRELVDTYIVTAEDFRSYNLQVWNRDPTEAVLVQYNSGEVVLSKDIRLVLVRIDPKTNLVRSIYVLSPEYIIQNFGVFGKETIKHQLLVSPEARAQVVSRIPPILVHPDRPAMSPLLAGRPITVTGSIHDQPVSGQVMTLETLANILGPSLVGMRFGRSQTRNRGQELEAAVARALGYQLPEGTLLASDFPDIRAQVLEVKIQECPTVDLGLFNPQFPELVQNCGVSTEDVRYLIALINPSTEIIDGLVLCPGARLGDHFSYVRTTSYKCQRSIPASFFAKYDGSVFCDPGV